MDIILKFRFSDSLSLICHLSAIAFRDAILPISAIFYVLPAHISVVHLILPAIEL